MDKVFRDFTGMKKSEVKKAVREMLMEDFIEFLGQKYDKFGQISAGEVAMVVGSWTDEDGFPHDVPVVVKATAKAFYDSVGEKGRVTEQFLVEDMVDAYKNKPLSAAKMGRPRKVKSED